ncbi:MAG TPA: hypothetical protein VMU30_02995 [Bacteroidota bacterium]|nr:hypothetical protein [Bacteroidota bacterium]
MKLFRKIILAGMLIAAVALPPVCNACACGCSVFSVGSMWKMPTSSETTIYFMYNYMDQNANWSGSSSAARILNDDKEIRTNFYTLGIQYMADRDWGITVDVPVWNRYFLTTDDDGNLASVNHTAVSDMRITGMYTGLSEDMSTGIVFGVKLPTGPFNESLFDRDTQIGTGTTDVLLGGYHMRQEHGWGWFAHAMIQYALNMRDAYRPGNNFDVSAGVHYDNLWNTYGIVPILQVVASFRGEDNGANADPDNTGYQRVYIAPGFKIAASGSLNIFADVKLPVMTHIQGNQLVAPSLATVAVSYQL